MKKENKEHLAFLSNPQYTSFIYETKATAVIVNKDFIAEKSINTTLIRVDDAYQSFRKLLEIYNQFKNNQIGIDSSASIDETAKLGENIFIGALTHIGKGC